MARLGEVASFLNGGTPSRSVPAYFQGSIPWITGTDIDGPVVTLARSHITEEAVSESATNLVPPGTILLVTRTSVGKVAVAGAPLCFSQDITAILPMANAVDTGYLVHFLRTRQPHFERHARGATIKGITREVVAGLELPLPPLPQQRRVAAILDQADALRAKRREALAKLDELTQAIFLEMFGDPATNPKGWPVRSIGELCIVKGGKRLPKGEAYSPHPTPFRYIRVTDLRAGTVDEAQLVYLTPEVQARIKRYTVHVGDVIVSIAGSIGLVAVVPPSLDGTNLTENAAKLVPRQAKDYDSEYLAAVLRTSHLQRQINSHTGQVTIGKLALFRIERLSLPVPPVSLQDEFAAWIRDIRGLRAHLTNSAFGIDSLFASLQHRAFRGEL